MAGRFHHGGRLLVCGSSDSAADAAHVVVEFVHPVIVGKPALPALALPADAPALELLARPGDMLLVVATGTPPGAVLDALDAARAGGLLTVALVGAVDGAGPPGRYAEHILVVHSADPLVVKEVQVTMYHLLWELVHVFLDRPEVLS
jgi:D-sedoheptulose 7-phosphate isomerase